MDDNIRQELLKYRLEHCLSQKALGELIGATQSQVSRWETCDRSISKLREDMLSRWLKRSIVP